MRRWHKAIRIECRVGADLNPYLAIAAQLAAGIKGIEAQLDCPKPSQVMLMIVRIGINIPNNLRAATEALRHSEMLKDAMGEAVIAHYTRAAEWEQEAFDNVVTDWEIARGFERA